MKGKDMDEFEIGQMVRIISANSMWYDYEGPIIRPEKNQDGLDGYIVDVPINPDFSLEKGEWFQSNDLEPVGL